MKIPAQTLYKYIDMIKKQKLFWKYAQVNNACQVGMSMDRYYSDIYPLAFWAKTLHIVEANSLNIQILKSRFHPKNILIYNFFASNTEKDQIKLVWKNRLQESVSMNYCTYIHQYSTHVISRKLDHIPKLDFICITVNGAEYEVLQGATEHLKQGTTIMWVGNRRYSNSYCIDHDAEIIRLLKHYKYKITNYPGYTQDLFIGE